MGRLADDGGPAAQRTSKPLTAVPPSGRPQAGKRRPRPCGQAQSPSPKTVEALRVSIPTTAEATEALNVSDRTASDELARLRDLVKKLTIRCQNQELELVEIRQRAGSMGLGKSSLVEQ